MYRKQVIYMGSFYNVFMYPLEKLGIRKARRELVPRAKKKILEIGSGTGANLRYYRFSDIQELTLSDNTLSVPLINLHRRHSEKFDLVQLDVQELPFADNSFDFIIHTLVFCSVTDVDKGLKEIKRVLKCDGELLFIEHVLPSKKPLKSVFSFINPAWKKMASGCNLNRDYLKSLEKNNFEISYHKNFMNTAFVYGVATPKPHQ